MKKLKFVGTIEDSVVRLSEGSCDFCNENKKTVAFAKFDESICGDCAEQIALAISNKEATEPSGLEEFAQAEDAKGHPADEILH